MLMLRFCRRAFFIAIAGTLIFSPLRVEAAGGLRIATFQSNITPPLGQPLFTCEAIKTVESPLLAKGIVLEADGNRYVLCALDWCTLSGSTYDSFRAAIASAAKTVPSRVALQTVHQHTAPMVDGDAWKLLKEAGVPQYQLDPKVVEDIESRLADAVRKSISRLEPFDRVGTGQAKVDRVASCRRAITPEGKVVTRYSTCKAPDMRALPEGIIDPYLKTITFARGDKPLVRLHYYATHPQTHYGDGRISQRLRGRRPRAGRKKGGRLSDLLQRLRRRHHRGQVQRRLETLPRRS